MKTECVKVMIRVRPLNKKEKSKKCKNILSLSQKEKSISIKSQTKLYIFNNIFTQADTQKQVYEKSAFQIVESILQGYNGTIFAYGQTGCGKTFTMLGDIKNPENKGIIPRACSHILTRIASDKNNFEKYNINCSFVELYNEKIYDLMEKEKVKKDLKQSPKGVFIKNLINVPVSNLSDILRVLSLGDKNRSVGETAMNKGSSRSHCIFQITIQTFSKKNGIETIKNSKLNLVDLAGSERQSKTKAKGIRLKEANNINLSLSALGNVIGALTSKRKSHIPYRDSKLTRLLQDSLGGNTKTLMMAAVSPADYNLEETLSTLKYASRASKIRNKPVVNEDPRDKVLKGFERELGKLKDLLKRNGDGIFKRISVVRNSESVVEFEHNETRVVLQREVRKREELEMQIEEIVLKIGKVENKNELVVDEREREYLEKVRGDLKVLEIEDREFREKEEREKKIKLLKNNKKEKLEFLKNQLEELENENIDEFHSNLEDIQEQTNNLKNNENELNFLKKVTGIIFSKKEIDYLKKNVIQLENEDDIMIPEFSFVYKSEKKHLPSLRKKFLTTIKENKLPKDSQFSYPVNNVEINYEKYSSPLKNKDQLYNKKNIINHTKFKYNRIKLKKMKNPIKIEKINF